MIKIQIRNVGGKFAAFAFIPAGQTSKAWQAKVDAMLAEGEISEAMYEQYIGMMDKTEGEWIDFTTDMNFPTPSTGEVLDWATLQCATPTNEADGSEGYAYPFAIGGTVLATLTNAEAAGYYYTTTATLK